MPTDPKMEPKKITALIFSCKASSCNNDANANSIILNHVADKPTFTGRPIKSNYS